MKNAIIIYTIFINLISNSNARIKAKKKNRNLLKYKTRFMFDCLTVLLTIKKQL